MFAKKSSSASDASKSPIETLINQGCEIKGDMSSEGSVKVDGKILGNVDCQALLIVAEKGVVQGDIRCKELVIYGEVIGKVTAEVLHLKKSSVLSGEINTSRLEVEPGAHYDGQVSMKSDTVKPKALSSDSGSVKAA